MDLEVLDRLVKKRIKELSVNKKLDNKRIYLFGYNGYSVFINNILHEQDYSLAGIIDNDIKKQGRSIYDVFVFAPENVEWGKDCIVLILSKHRRDMERQIRYLSQETEIIVLADLIKCAEASERKDKFWLDENFRLESKKLYQGFEIYNKLKQKERLVLILPALGDMFAVGLYLYEYEKISGSNSKIVVSSKGVLKVAQLFGIKNIVIISEREMDALVKYIFFQESGNEDICTCINVLDIMAEYKRLPFPKFWAKYYFRLTYPYKVYFPSIYDKKLNESILTDQGIIKGKTVVLAPYANSVEELPIQFWELLVDKLLENNFCIFTNVTNSEKPIKKTKAIKIPLSQIGNYLDYAGYFVSLRSGICDVAGQSMCKKIVLFIERKYINHCPHILFFDLCTENIAINIVQLLYKDEMLLKNIENVMRLILDN